MKALKTFMKPFEAQQRRVKIKNLIYILIQLSEMHGTGRVKFHFWTNLIANLYLCLTLI